MLSGGGYPMGAAGTPAQVTLGPAAWVGAVLLMWGSSSEAVGDFQGRQPSLSRARLREVVESPRDVQEAPG